MLVSRGSKVGICGRFDRARGTAPHARESGRNNTAASSGHRTRRSDGVAPTGSCIVPIHADSLTAAAADSLHTSLDRHTWRRERKPSFSRNERIASAARPNAQASNAVSSMPHPPKLAERSTDPAWRFLRYRCSAPISPTVAKTTKNLAQFADRRHGLAIAASRQALGDGWSPSSMRWNHLR